MNDRQIEIADLLLNNLASNEGQLNTDQLSYIFTKEKNYTWTEISFVRDCLIDESLINWYGDKNYRIKLNSDGWKAKDSGYKQFAEVKSLANQKFINSNINYGNNYGNQIVDNSVKSESPVDSKQHSQSIFWAIAAIVVTIIIFLIQHFS